MFRLTCLTALVLLLCFSGVRAYEAGDVSLALGAVYSPIMIGTDFGEVNVNDSTAGICHDAQLGKPGVGGEVQLRYFVAPRLALGLSAEDQYFSSDVASGFELNTRTRMRQYMLFAHYFLPEFSSYRIYVPVAAGAAHTDFSMDFREVGANKQHFTYTGFSGYLGIGAEKDLSARVSIGAEARYHLNRFHDSRTRNDGHRVTVYPRANFFSFVLRVICKI